jgi:hypothetical protein
MYGGPFFIIWTSSCSLPKFPQKRSINSGLSAARRWRQDPPPVCTFCLGSLSVIDTVCTMTPLIWHKLTGFRRKVLPASSKYQTVAHKITKYFTIYLYSYSQHVSIYSGVFPCSLCYVREFLLLVLHWLPLNFIILKVDVTFFWVQLYLNILNENISLWCRWYSFYFRFMFMSIYIVVCLSIRILLKFMPQFTALYPKRQQFAPFFCKDKITWSTLPRPANHVCLFGSCTHVQLT